MSVINPVYGKLKKIARLEGANLSKSAWLKDLALLSELSRNLNKKFRRTRLDGAGYTCYHFNS